MFENTIQEAPVWCVAPLVVTAVGSIVLFFYPTLFLNLAKLAIGG
jgi:multicomponent Na+:H+ antiporter subunit D